MEPLPMPSDVKDLATGAAADVPAIEPPSVKLLVRLFLIPFFIVAAAVGVMFLIGRLVGGTPSVDGAIARLKNPGGQCTADWLIGPGSKQRDTDAKTLVDQMKAGMNEAERIKLTGELIDVLDNHTRAEEASLAFPSAGAGPHLANAGSGESGKPLAGNAVRMRQSDSNAYPVCGQRGRFGAQGRAFGDRVFRRA